MCIGIFELGIMNVKFSIETVVSSKFVLQSFQQCWTFIIRLWRFASDYEVKCLSLKSGITSFRSVYPALQKRQKTLVLQPKIFLCAHRCVSEIQRFLELFQLCRIRQQTKMLGVDLTPYVNYSQTTTLSARCHLISAITATDTEAV